jgi:hypothetical protein
VALVRVYCGLASTPSAAAHGSAAGALTAAVVDDAGRLLDVCDISDDPAGYAELGTLLAERSGGTAGIAVAADSDEHQVTLLLAAAGRPLAIADEESLDDYAERFGDDDSPDEVEAPPSERRAVGLARALQAGALAAAALAAPRELMALKPVLAAHAALATGRQGAAVALREVLRELYPAALRAYPDPAEPIPLAVLDALPEPGLLGAGTASRGRDAAVATDLADAGVADHETITQAITALRVAIAETPRRTGIGKTLTTAVAQTIRQSVAAVHACDTAVAALVGLLAEKATPVPAGRSTLPTRPRNGAPPATPQTATPQTAALQTATPQTTALQTATPQTDAPLESGPLGNGRLAGGPLDGGPLDGGPLDGGPLDGTPPNGTALSGAPLRAIPEAAAEPLRPPAHRRSRSAGQPPANAPVATEPAALSQPPAALPPRPVPQAPLPQASLPQAPLSHAPLPQAPLPPAPAALPPARRSQAPAALPQAPQPQAPLPQAPLPHAPAADHPAPMSAPPVDPYQSTAPGFPNAPGFGYRPPYPDDSVPSQRPAPDVPAPGSRSDWPLNTTGSLMPEPPVGPEPLHPTAYPSSTLPSTVLEPLAHNNDHQRGTHQQRDGRVTPPWQADDLPSEPPALRLVEPAPLVDRALRDNRSPSEPLRDPLAGIDPLAVIDPFGHTPLPEPPPLSGAAGGNPPPLRLVESGPGGRPGKDQRDGAAVGEDGDGDLLIFAQARSAWFTGNLEPVEDPELSWNNPADLGWQAAERAAQPVLGDETTAGLPRRVPQANLVPGSPLPAPTDDRSLRIVRDPAAMAAHTTGYFRGSRRGEEVRGFAGGGRPGREEAGGWDFSRDGWEGDQDGDRGHEYRSAARR